jgi:hypothetical protein
MSRASLDQRDGLVIAARNTDLNNGEAVCFLDDSPAATEQVEEQNYGSNHKQQMNRPAADTADHP